MMRSARLALPLILLTIVPSAAHALRYEREGTLTIDGQEAPFRIRGRDRSEFGPLTLTITINGKLLCYRYPCPFRRGRFYGAIHSDSLVGIVVAVGELRKGRQRCAWDGTVDFETHLVEADFNCNSGQSGHLSFPVP